MELPTNQLHDNHIKLCILAVLVGRNKAGAAQLVRNFDWLSVLLEEVGYSGLQVVRRIEGSSLGFNLFFCDFLGRIILGSNIACSVSIS